MVGNRLDEIDIKILNHLQHNARISLSQLANLVNISNSPVTERIRKLEEAGFITHYFTMLDRAKIGRPVLVILSVKVNPQNRKILLQFEKCLEKLPEVQSVWVVSGDWNFVVHITAKSPQDYFLFLMEKISSLPYVDQTESAFVLKECKAFSPFAL
jgi:Lrp/AsnC family leucine-responsive transcriptional regulator